MATSRKRRDRPKKPSGTGAGAVPRGTPGPLLKPATRQRLWILFAAALVLVVLANFVIPGKGHFGIDGSFAFFAWFGFLSCVAVILVGKVLGVFLRRDEGYYRQGLDLGDDPPPGDRAAGDSTPGPGR